MSGDRPAGAGRTGKVARLRAQMDKAKVCTIKLVAMPDDRGEIMGAFLLMDALLDDLTTGRDPDADDAQE